MSMDLEYSCKFSTTMSGIYVPSSLALDHHQMCEIVSQSATRDATKISVPGTPPTLLTIVRPIPVSRRDFYEVPVGIRIRGTHPHHQPHTLPTLQLEVYAVIWAVCGVCRASCGRSGWLALS